MIVYLILGLVCLIGLALTSIEVVLSILFFLSHQDRRPGIGKRKEAASDRPIVSILKPLSGSEDELEQNLASFTDLRGVDHEVILSVSSLGDLSVPAIDAVQGRFPNAPFIRLIGGITPGLVANLKVERLLAAQRIARGEILFISDSNVRVSPEDIERTVRLFDDPTVGCVSNPFTGLGASTLGSTIESLYLLVYVIPGCVFAQTCGRVCVVGKSMAIRREVLDAIGGFESFSHVLAEDQAIGLAVKQAGYRVVLAPTIVRNVSIKRTLREALARQIRWNKIRYSFSRRIYAAEFLANPFPVAALASIAAIAFRGEITSVVLPAGAMLIRFIQAAVLNRTAAAGISVRRLMLMPIQDVLQFIVQWAPLFSSEVRWRTVRTRLGRDSLMLSALLDRRTAAQSPLEEAAP
ncbi:MAG TPA: glycosyltransferase [Blastocatellia bacterium]|nr:glycosyltransferase [Blastocatellia bacterium]